MIQNSRREGFTLLEVLLVVAAIGILAGIVILAINPGKQLGDTRNAQRRVDVNTDLNAIYQYALDNNGNLPVTIPAPPVLCTAAASEICKTGGTCTGLVDLSVLTQNELYLVAMPADPQGGEAADGTGYHVVKTANGRVTVCAPKAERGAQISVTR